MSGVITASFDTREAAEKALHKLENAGVTESQVSIIISDDTHGTHFTVDRESKSDEGIVAGGLAGGLVGAVLASILSAGALAVPAAGIVISGWLVSAAAGMGAGMAAGGVIGGLIGAGIPEDEAKVYEDAVKSGAILMAVRPESDEQSATVKSALSATDAHNIAA
ncbi:MAG: hypothetical protein DI586_10990 [Micavibrio aeruginosavorus]|uniref:General stress protein 17M-like domain-containing protein n=1 Tax=Micavibrio aeruginosavorus TaxID=349221 RepID=A0A2W5HDA2_9BACT|nr:MAG: hypothetical protein DI586_10990 [Micavibrio aeruginosavorus]